MGLYDNLPNKIRFTNKKGKTYTLQKRSIAQPPYNPNQMAKNRSTFKTKNYG